MNWAKLGVLVSVSMLLFCACTHNERLERALEFAGENRGELEKVLVHYKDSGLKLDAARFLIENMPAYYSYKGDELDSIKVVQAGIYYKKRLVKELKEKWAMFSPSRLRKVYDAKVITADYLIENIDLAFASWQKSPWGKSVSFDEFCEWILPYRIGDEPLENWRKTYYDKYSVLLDSLYQGDDVVVAADSLMRVLVRRGWIYNTDLQLPRLGAMFLEKQCVGYCRETCDYSTYVLRSVGIPTGTDILIGTPETAGGHMWNVVKDSTGVVPFWFEPVLRGNDDGRKKGKVYRICFGMQKEKIQGMRTEQEVPQILRNPYIKDVTRDYFGDTSAEIELEEKPQGKYIYLGISSRSGWIPIDVIVPHGKKATFEGIAPEVIYMPLFWEDGRFREAGYPFKLTKTGICRYFPEHKTEDAVLYRKYPLQNWTRYHLAGIVGSKIEASNTLDFKHSELLYHIVDTPKTNYNPVQCMPRQKYRYVRFTAAKNQLARIGELMLYRGAGEESKIDVKAVAGSIPDLGNEDVSKEKMCDGDFLTYFLSDEKGGYATLDLGKPEHIERLVYVPRNDDNYITPGDTYELLYQGGARGWVSLGRQIARERRLIYNNVPQKALLWLRNVSRGREEQVFWMENGKQVFLEK